MLKGFIYWQVGKKHLSVSSVHAKRVNGCSHKFGGILFNGAKICFFCTKALPLKWCVILSY